MRRVLQLRSVVLLLVVALLAAACGGGESEGSSGGDSGASEGGSEAAAAADSGGGEGLIAVLLPDSASSARWESDDRPAFEAAFEELGLSSSDYQIQNAEGDASNQQSQAEQAITNGATVLVLTNLDSGSGAAIIQNAKAQDVAVIDYDRLTLDGDADYYVSFDNESVGRLQGETLVECVQEEVDADPVKVAVLNGSPTDNNATLFKNGYDSVINPKFESGEWEEVDDQSVPDWDNQQALVIFEQMLTAADGDINAVLAANDGLANAVIQALKSANQAGIPVTGQDATVEGLQNIVTDNQCMTVYKSIGEEAQAAAELAVALRNGEQPETDATVDNGSKEVPAVLLEPVAVTEDNIMDTVIADDFRTVEEICSGDVAETDWCQENSG
ncbi:MAG: substrate-binding domain-containing protein [Actinobacteria bacterium]|nr:substrate-binding domain-containing protein [Actinomycetota bacterium]